MDSSSLNACDMVEALSDRAEAERDPCAPAGAHQ